MVSSGLRALGAACLVAASLAGLLTGGWLSLPLWMPTGGPAVPRALSTAGPPGYGVDFPSREAGIRMPAAVPVAGFSGNDVGLALDSVRRALVAGRLDERMLVHHDPALFVSLLAPAQRERVRAWFTGAQATNVATRTSGPPLRADAPLVSGTVAVVPGRDGVGRATLDVVTAFQWVYAFRTSEPSSITVTDEIRWRFYPRGTMKSDDDGMWIASVNSSLFGHFDCEAAERGILTPRPRTPGTC